MLAANTFRVSRHTGGHGGRSRFLTPFPAGNIGNYTHRKPYRKGVVCVTVASLILICGSIMTILGATHVFGGSVTIVGMMMMAVAVLLFLFSIRQFLLAKKLRLSEQNLQITHGTVTAMVIEREDELGTVTVVMDTVNIEPRCRERNCNQEEAPPDYTETTCEFYPDSSVGEGVETPSEPPPPYGPPTYDEVLTDKIKSGETPSMEYFNEEEYLNEGETSVNVGDENQTDTVSQSSHPRNHDIANTPRQSVDRTPNVLVGGYQDLPTVTI